MMPAEIFRCKRSGCCLSLLLLLPSHTVNLFLHCCMLLDRSFFILLFLCTLFLPAMSGTQHTTRPIVTGTSVVGLTYKGGVLLAADTMLSYGSMAKSFQTPRMVSIDDRILLGASGEYSDFQEIVNKVEALCLEEQTQSMESIYEQRKLPAASLWKYLRAVLYNRRSKYNPFWNDVVVAGYENDAPFLGVIDKLGTTLKENLVATGFGAYLAMPLLRE
jgi:20S proteasome subunit beta 7